MARRGGSGPERERRRGRGRRRDDCADNSSSRRRVPGTRSPRARGSLSPGCPPACARGASSALPAQPISRCFCGPSGTRPATYGLKALSDPQGSRELHPPRNQIGTRFAAVEVLSLAARRDPMALAAAIRLAESVLGAPDEAQQAPDRARGRAHHKTPPP